MLNLKPLYSLAAALVVSSMNVGMAQVFENSQLNGIGNDSGFGVRNISLDDIIDSKYLKDSTQTFVKIQAYDEVMWELKESTSFVHNISGQEVHSITKLVDDGIWKNQHRSDNYFGTSHLILEQTESNWVERDWKAILKRQFTYNSLDQASEILVLEKEDNTWERSTKTTYDYGQNELVSEEVLFMWDQNSNEWVAESRILFTYNEATAINTEVVQVWDDSLNIWVNDYRQEFEYNEDNRVVKSTRNVWNSNTNDWDIHTVLSLEYNSEGKLSGSRRFEYDGTLSVEEHSEDAYYGADGNLGETVLSNLDSQSGNWEEYQKKKHYWSEHIQGNLTESMGDIDCRFANPYLLGLPWYCDNLKEDVNYTVQVFDLMGRSFYKSNFYGGATFRLKNNIPPGLYTVVISGGLDVHSEKVLIRN